MNDGVAAVLARINELDTRLRDIDPAWQGLDSAWQGVADTSPASSEFDSLLAGGAGADGTATTSSPFTFQPRTAIGAGGSVGARAAQLEDGLVPMVAPLPGARLTQPFGPTSLTLEPPATVDGVHYRHFHDGLDLAAPLGTAVRAAADGVVELAGRLNDGAVAVRVRHPDGSETFYAHLEPDLPVKAGDTVSAGETIGNVGVTGHTTGPHLHLGLRRDGRSIDPAPWLAAGRLPGAAPATSQGTGSDGQSDALGRFDAVADRIPFASDIRAAAVSAEIDPLLLASLVHAESSFHPTAVSYAGAQGLTQLMPATARALRVDDPFDPAQNVSGGAKYLASDLKLYGRVDLALAAYQAGKGAVARAGGIPASQTTHNYIHRILSYWSSYLKEATA